MIKCLERNVTSTAMLAVEVTMSSRTAAAQLRDNCYHPTVPRTGCVIRSRSQRRRVLVPTCPHTLLVLPQSIYEGFTFNG